MIFELATDIFLMLLVAAFIAGFIDSIAGGGGLITTPALLLAGLPPLQVLGTNKLQSSFGSATATLNYARAGHVKLREQLPMALISIVASAVGAVIAHLVPTEVLRFIMPVVLIGIAVFFALRKGISDRDSARRIGGGLFALTIVPLIAAYDGFFGPGTGSFFMIAFVALAGYGLLKATAHTKLLNFSSNIGALAVFAYGGHVLWGLGLSMAVAQVFGALMGSRMAMRNGSRMIKPLLVFTSVAMALRLIWQVVME